MHNKQQISNHFSAELFDQYYGEQVGLPDTFYAGRQYWAWRAVKDAPLPWTRLMPRARAEHWLYSHFLKICLPARRDHRDGAPVYAPLNLTAFWRLVVLLHEKGYPAHWLAGAVESLSSGTISTTARAPKKEAVDAKDVDEICAKKDISVAPWKAEFTTLLAIWRKLVPFGFATGKDALVGLQELCEYSITFPDFNPEHPTLRVPHFILVFFDGKLGKTPASLRDVLRDEESGDVTAEARRIRAEGVHVVSTFTYVTDTRTASFWMRRDVAETWAGGDWMVSVWRTDSWRKQIGEIPVAGNMAKLRPWI